MEGRGDDTKGIELATNMLEQRYKSLGLEPAGTQGFFQPFSVITGAKLLGNNSIHEQVGGITKDLKLNDEFVPFSFSSSGQAAAPVVFAGYGATRRRIQLRRLRRHRRRGKIVVLLRYEPPGFAAQSRQSGTDPARGADHQSDQRPQSRRQSRRRRQRQTRQRRARHAHALRQRQRSRKRRHHSGASEK